MYQNKCNKSDHFLIVLLLMREEQKLRTQIDWPDEHGTVEQSAIVD